MKFICEMLEILRSYILQVTEKPLKLLWFERFTKVESIKYSCVYNLCASVS